MSGPIVWGLATVAGSGHDDAVNQDVAWHSSDGLLALIADGAERSRHGGEIASHVIVRTATDLYRTAPEGDFIERLVHTANSALLRLAAEDHLIGTTTLVLAHTGPSNRVRATIFGDGALLLAHSNGAIESVRPLRKYDYYFSDPAELREADAVFEALPLFIRVSILSLLPWASVGIVPRIVSLQVGSGEALILCSDGVSDVMTAHQIAAVHRGKDPEAAARAIVDRALSQGSTDDATCLVGLLV